MEYYHYANVFEFSVLRSKFFIFYVKNHLSKFSFKAQIVGLHIFFKRIALIIIDFLIGNFSIPTISQFLKTSKSSRFFDILQLLLFTASCCSHSHQTRPSQVNFEIYFLHQSNIKADIQVLISAPSF